MAAASAILARYPSDLWDEITFAVVSETSRPTLDVIARACEAAYEPTLRALERRRSHEQHLMIPRGPEKRTPEEQQRVDELVEKVRRLFPVKSTKGIWS